MATLLGATVAPVAAAVGGAAPSATCSGSFDQPGILASGTYSSVSVTGPCFVPPSSTIAVLHGLTVEPGGFLVAAGALDGPAPSCTRSITISGGVAVKPGGSLILGDGEGSGCVPNTHTVVNGGLHANGAIDLIIHGVVVNGGLDSMGGGDGGPCNFASPTGPVYATVEDSQVNGGLTLSGYNACWLGFARNHVTGGVTLQNNVLDDPDAMEILSNSINGGLACSGNVAGGVPRATNLVDNPDGSHSPEPNTVHGLETGQCVGL